MMIRLSRSAFLPVLVSLPVLAVLVSLGTWQVHRLSWKEGLIDRVKTRMTSEPVPLASPEEWGAPDFIERLEYQPISGTGRFLPEKTLVAYTVLSDAKGALSGPGYWIMTPFRIEAGGTVYVNRGFVPFDRLEDVSPPDDGVVALTGVVRAPERGNAFTPEPDLERNTWYNRDPERFAAIHGLEQPVATFFIDAASDFTPAGGLPQAGETRTLFSNNHLQYAVTWYGLALTLIAVTIAFVWGRVKSL